jgi:hypothetical protein
MLHLHLVSASGVFPWKTELPYPIAKGAKNLDNENGGEGAADSCESPCERDWMD